MKIGITTDSIDAVEHLKGVANYTKNLVKGINNLITNNSLSLIHFRHNNDEIYNLHLNEITIKLSYGYNSPSKLLGYIFKQKSLKELDIIHINFPDIFQFPLFYLPVKKVLTIHDISNLDNSQSKANIRKDTKGWLLQKLRWFWFSIVKDKINAYIVTTNFLKEKVIKRLNIPKEKIYVVYEGVDHKKFKPINISRSPYPFILTVTPYLELIRIYHKLKQGGIKHKLVIFSFVFPNSVNDEAKKLVENLNLQNDVIFLGYVSDKKLVELYNTASVFVHLEPFDGFNLPTLEAMACGCPVVLNDIDATFEVFGDAAILSNPFDIDELAEATYNILTNEKLRQAMIKKGFEKAEKFSWEKTIKETLKVYEEVIK